MELYFKRLRGRDFAYQERALVNGNDYLFAGRLEAGKQGLLMKNTRLVIGSDRNDFYEFLGRRKETIALQNRNLLKLCIGVTALHFILVQVPTQFSRYFGDPVDDVSKTLGAVDRREE